MSAQLRLIPVSQHDVRPADMQNPGLTGRHGLVVFGEKKDLGSRNSAPHRSGLGVNELWLEVTNPFAFREAVHQEDEGIRKICRRVGTISDDNAAAVLVMRLTDGNERGDRACVANSVM